MTTTEDVCRNCGDWVATLVDETGWCPTCSGHKTCNRCGTSRPLTDYRTDPRTSDGRRGTCSPCLRQVEHERRQDQIDKVRAQQREKSRRYRERHKAAA